MGRKPKTQTVETPKRGRPRKHKRANGYHYINGAQVLFSDNVEALQKEVIKLNEWCLEWRKKYEDEQAKRLVLQEDCIELEELNDIGEKKIYALLGVINYLEDKLEEDKE